jgi:hypothetical protein
MHDLWKTKEHNPRCIGGRDLKNHGKEEELLMNNFKKTLFVNSFNF